MKASSAAQVPEPKLFLPSRRDALLLALAGAASLGTALFLRYGIIQNTPLGLACEAGREALSAALGSRSFSCSSGTCSAGAR